ncbi:F-box/kelch-repeat protein [Trifolium pratense]|uniref:F-box/kelch-repeat protein n=1 Tax=Trifolium pratense TaxID=57577 RepID=A0A2K3N9F9_TRIPR|nr:F-box/kelch-repeat protein [Trifolium pratense]
MKRKNRHRGRKRTEEKKKKKKKTLQHLPHELIIQILLRLPVKSLTRFKCVYTSLDGVSSHLEFFSLRANTWKEIEGTHFPYITVSGAPKVGSLIDGAIHWLAFRRDLDSTVIVAFDLMERELVEMSFPDYIDIELIDCDLWVFGEFLALWVMDMEDNDKVDIWVMKEYKVRSSWTKTLVLSIDVNSTGFFYPICCTKSGDIIGTDGHTQLLKYDDKGQVIEHYSYNKRGGSQLAMYTESLLSLPGDSEQA